MRCVVLDGAGRLHHVECPEPVTDGAVVVRVAAVGLCGTDLLAWRLRRGAPSQAHPLVLGHEVSGVVVLDPTGTWAAGTLVLVDPAITCGACAACRRGDACDALAVVGDTYGAGGLAELIAVPPRALIAVPDGLSLRSAALVEPLACAHHAVARSGVRAGDHAAVLGAGGLGMSIGLVLRAYGVDVLLAEPRVARRAAATEAGFATVDVAPGDAAADVAFEASGAPGAVAAACRAVVRSGTVVVAAQHPAELVFDAGMLFGRELRLTWSLGASRADFTRVLELLETGAVPAPPYAHAVGLADVDDRLFSLLSSGECGKTLVAIGDDVAPSVAEQGTNARGSH
jgi:threonine dehydrogenase-like Zn-dependent dehydrogenase